MVSLVITLSCVSAFSSLLKLVLINFPKTFTVGEAMVVVQSIPLFVSAASIQYVQSLLNGVNEEYAFINTLVFVSIFYRYFLCVMLSTLHRSGTIFVRSKIYYLLVTPQCTSYILMKSYMKQNNS